MIREYTEIQEFDESRPESAQNKRKRRFTEVHGSAVVYRFTDSRLSLHRVEQPYIGSRVQTQTER